MPGNLAEKLAGNLQNLTGNVDFLTGNFQSEA